MGKSLQLCGLHGTALCSLLFLVMGHNLSKNCQHSMVSCFIEETRMLAIVRELKDMKIVLTDIKEIVNWAAITTCYLIDQNLI